MTETIKTLLQPIQNRLEAALDAPWEVVDDPMPEGDWMVRQTEADPDTPDVVAAVIDHEDTALFIANAPTDQARLLAVLQAVLDLHDLTFYDKWGRSHTEDQGKGGWCRTCGRFEGLSCHTFAAIESALTEAS
jgi:hypothetical protein